MKTAINLNRSLLLLFAVSSIALQKCKAIDPEYKKNGVNIEVMLILEGDTVYAIKTNTTDIDQINGKYFLPTVDFVKKYMELKQFIKSLPETDSNSFPIFTSDGFQGYGTITKDTNEIILTGNESIFDNWDKDASDDNTGGGYITSLPETDSNSYPIFTSDGFQGYGTITKDTTEYITTLADNIFKWNSTDKWYQPYASLPTELGFYTGPYLGSYSNYDTTLLTLHGDFGVNRMFINYEGPESGYALNINLISTNQGGIYIKGSTDEYSEYPFINLYRNTTSQSSFGQDFINIVDNNTTPSGEIDLSGAAFSYSRYDNYYIRLDPLNSLNSAEPNYLFKPVNSSLTSVFEFWDKTSKILSGSSSRVNINRVLNLAPTTAPTSPSNGDMYFGTNGELHIYKSSAWHTINTTVE